MTKIESKKSSACAMNDSTCEKMLQRGVVGMLLLRLAFFCFGCMFLFEAVLEYWFENRLGRCSVSTLFLSLFSFWSTRCVSVFVRFIFLLFFVDLYCDCRFWLQVFVFFQGDVYLVKQYCTSFNLFVGRKTNLIFNSPSPKELRNSLLTLRICVFS